eukprot:406038-Prorocentrum_minimum.AAC.1
MTSPGVRHVPGVPEILYMFTRLFHAHVDQVRGELQVHAHPRAGQHGLHCLPGIGHQVLTETRKQHAHTIVNGEIDRDRQRSTTHTTSKRRDQTKQRRGYRDERQCYVVHNVQLYPQREFG